MLTIENFCVYLRQTHDMPRSKISDSLENNSFTASFTHLKFRKETHGGGESKAGTGFPDSYGYMFS